MNKIYTLINEKTNGKYKDVRFPYVAMSADNAVVSVVCTDSDFERVCAGERELNDLISTECGFHVPVKLDIRKSEPTAAGLRETVSTFTKKFGFVASVANDVSATVVPECAVTLKMHSGMIALAKDDFIPRLEEHLKNNYVCPVAVRIETVEFKEQASQEAQKDIIYKLSRLSPVYGSVDAQEALSAACANRNIEEACVCGVLTMPTEFLSKGGGGKRSREYEKFILYDGENTLQCRFYPREKCIAGELVNKRVCVTGSSILERDRTDEAVLTVRAIAECDADGLSVVPQVPEPALYANVAPKPYEEYIQSSIFESSESIPESLRGTFVVFDFETTGLSVKFDKPTEIGAVKIVDGVITETFSTLIDPQRPIPDIVAQKTGITDEMVKGKPLIEEVLPDFYKFTYGCALIGHNIAFDFAFLLKFGNRFGYPFGDRRTYDTMGLAPRAIKGIEALSLGKVTDALGIINDSAHRALSDATATAKAFIAMQKRICSAGV